MERKEAVKTEVDSNPPPSLFDHNFPPTDYKMYDLFSTSTGTDLGGVEKSNSLGFMELLGIRENFPPSCFDSILDNQHFLQFSTAPSSSSAAASVLLEPPFDPQTSSLDPTTPNSSISSASSTGAAINNNISDDPHKTSTTTSTSTRAAEHEQEEEEKEEEERQKTMKL